MSLIWGNSDTSLFGGVWGVHQTGSQFDVDIEFSAGTGPYTSVLRNGLVMFEGITILAVMAKGVWRSLL